MTNASYSVLVVRRFGSSDMNSFDSSCHGLIDIFIIEFHSS
jgi:hypothetical protein